DQEPGHAPAARARGQGQHDAVERGDVVAGHDRGARGRDPVGALDVEPEQDAPEEPHDGDAEQPPSVQVAASSHPRMLLARGPNDRMAAPSTLGRRCALQIETSALRDIAEQRYADFVDALREMVNVDCGSYTPEGVNAIADLCQARFERGGWAVERMRHEPTGDQERLGDLVIGRLEGGGRARVLMIGHTDTVFDPGTVAERPF